MQVDVIVMGLGGMGTSTCYHLQKRGVSVIGIEQFRIGHDRGSSHGDTRMIRQAYFEHPDYVPLLRRSYVLWDELAMESKKNLFHRTGVVYFGLPTSKALAGVRESARIHKLQIEELSAVEADTRYPMFRCHEGFHAVFEPDAGYLEVDNCVREYAQLTRERGGVLCENEKVISWTAGSSGVTVKTEKNSYHAKVLVITSGAWRNERIPELAALSVHRNVVTWINADSSFDKVRGAPSFAIDLPNGFFYGFPRCDGKTIKMANHTPGQRVENPYEVNRQVTASDIELVLDCAGQWLRGVDLSISRSSVCLYTMTPDEHFVVDFHPDHSNVVFAAGFSGHGFKFASVIGEVLSQLSLDGKSTLPIDFLGLKRMRSPVDGPTPAW